MFNKRVLLIIKSTQTMFSFDASEPGVLFMAWHLTIIKYTVNVIKKNCN